MLRSLGGCAPTLGLSTCKDPPTIARKLASSSDAMLQYVQSLPQVRQPLDPAQRHLRALLMGVMLRSTW